MSFEIMTPGNAQTQCQYLDIDLDLSKVGLPDDLKKKITTNMKFSDLINLCKAVRFKHGWCDEPKLKEYIFDVQKCAAPVHVEGPEDQIVIDHSSLSINEGIEKYIYEFNSVIRKYDNYYHAETNLNKFGYWSAIFFCIEVYRRPLLWKVIPRLFQKMFLETYDEVTKNDAVKHFISSKKIIIVNSMIRNEKQKFENEILKNPERNPSGLILAASAMIKMVNDIFHDGFNVNGVSWRTDDKTVWRTDDKTVTICFGFRQEGPTMIPVYWCTLFINFSLKGDYSFEKLRFKFSVNGFDENHKNQLCQMFEGQGGEGNKFKYMHIHDTVDFAKPHHIEHKNVKVNVKVNNLLEIIDYANRDVKVEDEQLENDAVRKFFQKFDDIKKKVMSANAPLMLMHQLPSMSHVLDKMTRRFE